MEGDDAYATDLDIAATLGFSGFGSQSKNKRKFNQDDGFVDPDIAKKHVVTQKISTGSNTLPIGNRAPQNTRIASSYVSGDDNRESSSTRDHDATSASVNIIAPYTDRKAANNPPTVETLRHGVRNERGDMVYFLPSFLEDPWKGLQPQ